jgi:hypothetical protein
MKIMAQHLTRSTGILPLLCDCGQVVLYRVVDPSIDAHCPRCGQDRETERLVNELLIDENPTAFYDDPDDVHYDSFEIKFD